MKKLAMTIVVTIMLVSCGGENPTKSYADSNDVRMNGNLPTTAYYVGDKVLTHVSSFVDKENNNICYITRQEGISCVSLDGCGGE